MKQFTELSAAQQERAVEEAFRRLLRAVTDGGLRFNDLANGNDLQARIDEARERSSGISQLWRHLVARACSEELSTLARMSARDAVYSEGETVIAVDDL